MTVARYTSWSPPWEPLAFALTAGAIWLTARGVRLSTTALGAPSTGAGEGTTFSES